MTEPCGKPVENAPTMINFTPEQIERFVSYARHFDVPILNEMISVFDPDTWEHIKERRDSS